MSEVSGPGSLNAKFEKGVKGVADATSKLEPPAQSGQTQLERAAQERQADENFLSMAFISPRHAVLEAYIPLEKAALDLIESEDGNRKDLQMLLRNPIAALRRISRVPKNIAASAAELRHLRNQAAHQEVFDVEPEVVLEYVDAARNLTRTLASLTDSPSTVSLGP